MCLSPELDDCLAFVETIARCLPMVEFPLAPRPGRVRILLTDACYSSALQCVGVFLAVLRAHGPPRYYFAAARIPQWLLDAFAAFVQRKTYICQAELLAYLCAYLTFPDLLEGHLIQHFGVRQHGCHLWSRQGGIEPARLCPPDSCHSPAGAAPQVLPLVRLCLF